MAHLTLVPPLAPSASVAPVPVMPAQREPLRAPMAAYEDPKVVALSFFQSATGICLCRACSMKRHPAFGG
jgi:hypothetical protein